MHITRRTAFHAAMAVLATLIVLIGFTSALRLIPGGTSTVTSDGSTITEGGANETSEPSQSSTTEADSNDNSDSRKEDEHSTTGTDSDDDSDTTGEGGRTVRLGGATTDNLYPQMARTLRGPISCARLENSVFSVPVSIDEIAVETRIGPAEFELADLGGCDEPPCLGLELAARSITGDNLQCTVAVALPETPGKYDGYLVLGLSTTCTTREFDPCSRVNDPPPSPSGPVMVHWTVYQRINATVFTSSPDEDDDPTESPTPTSSDLNPTSSPDGEDTAGG